MGMTNREALRAAIDNMNSDGGIPNEQLNTVLLTSIADSLATIADALTDRKDDSNGNDR
jgi:hypothetical protein